MKKKLNLMGLGFNNAYIRKMLTVMRITVLLCLLGVLQVAAANTYSQEARISLDVREKPVSDVLRDIEEQSEFFFLYNNKLIDVDRLVDVEVNNNTITKVLDILFDDSIDRKIDDKLIVLSSIGHEKQGKSQAQSVRKGIVLSANDGMSLPGVSVVIKGTTIGTSTNIDGAFSIKANAGDILVFSFMGMVSQEFKVVDNKSIEIRLSSDALQVDEVMVVAYGTAKKSTFTGSAEVIKNDILEKTSSSSVASSLVGRVAGVSVATANSEAGSAPDIRIRGYGSFTADANPLYVVDGVANAPIPANEDIENLTVLKDAASASLYGSRAANGVIIITTKKGKGDIKFNFKYSQSIAWKSPDKIEMMGTDAYTKKAWEGLYNKKRYVDGDVDGAAQYAHDNFVETIGGQNPYANKNQDGTYSAMAQPFDDQGNLNDNAVKMIDTDWLDEVYRIGKTHNFHISASKGDDKSSLYTSLSYFDQEGIVIDNNYKKVNAVLNTETKINKFFTYGLNTNMYYKEGRDLNIAFLGDAYMYNPTMTIYELDDNYKIKRDENGNKLYDWDNPISRNHNVFAQSALNPDGYEKKGFYASPYIRLSPIEDLTVDVKGSARMNFHSDDYFLNPYNGAGKEKEGIAYKNNWDSKNYYGLIMANYSKKFDKHSLNVKLGYEVEDYTYKEVNASAKGFKLWETQRELQNGEKPDAVNSYTTETSKLSYISKLEYGYADKYYLSGSFRRDGSSKFGSDNRWGNFWSVGATWRLSEEQFIKDIEMIDNLKLRASYGVNGNDKIGNYKYHGLYSTANTYRDKLAVTFDRFANSNLGWESNKNLTIATEFSLFSRLRGTFEYYSRISSDLLLEKYYPQSSGASKRFENVGEVSNKGFELSLSYSVINNENFTWNTSLTASHNKNKITKLVGEAEYWDGQNLMKEGGSVQNLTMIDWAGVDPETGAPLWIKEVEDLNGNITREKMSNWDAGSDSHKGDPSPKIFGAWNNDIRFKNFDFSFQFYYSFGGHAYNDLAGLTHNDGAKPLWNMSVDAADSWSPDNKSAKNPRYTTYDKSKAWYRSSRFYDKIDYVKLKNLTIGYTFDKGLISKLKLSSARLFVMGENLLTFTNFDGYDPELEFDSTTKTDIVPPTTSITFGINATF